MHQVLSIVPALRTPAGSASSLRSDSYRTGEHSTGSKAGRCSREACQEEGGGRNGDVVLSMHT